MILSRAEKAYLQNLYQAEQTTPSSNPLRIQLSLNTNDTTKALDLTIVIGFYNRMLKDTDGQVVQIRVLSVNAQTVSGETVIEYFPTLITPGAVQSKDDWDAKFGVPVLFNPF